MSEPWRVLTVRQPWARAIMALGKDVENRTRNIAGGWRGPVAIHAGLRDDPDAWDSLEAGCALACGTDRPAWADLAGLARGAIVGVVNLVDAHPAYGSPGSCWTGWEDTAGVTREQFCSPWAGADGWHLVLRDPRRLPVPVPYRGGQGLRRLDPRVQTAVAAQLDRTPTGSSGNPA